MAPAKLGRPAAAAMAWALLGGAAPAEAGLKTGPPSRPAPGEPRRLQQGGAGVVSMSGLEYALSGYDVFFGNPLPTNGAVDEGFRRPVFKASYSDRDTLDGTPEGKPLPDGVSVLQCQDSCSLLSTERSIKSLEEYYDFLKLQVYAGVSFGDIASFSATADYQRVRAGFQSHDSVYTTATANCCAYKAFVHDFKPPPADDNFLAAVDAAPEDYDQDFYFGLIGEFGTHFLSWAQLGSMYGEEHRFTKDQFNEMTAMCSDWKVAARASLLGSINVSINKSINVSINASISHGENFSYANFFEHYSRQTLKYSLGARPPTPTKGTFDVQAWQTSTAVEPVPTSMGLKSLSELFTTVFLPSQTNKTKLKAKRENVERALREYCPEKLLKDGKVESCTEITNSSNAAADDKTCLAKVWGGGGPGGQPFDDSAMVELGGLFEGLRVRQILTFSPRWVNSIQLELALGTKSWPLPRHGGAVDDMRVSTWAFQEDQKIVAVDLKYDRYIDSIDFWTDDGERHPVGGPGGIYSKTVEFKAAVKNATGYLPRSAWLVGLYGHSQRYVDSLGFYVAYTCPSSHAPGPAGRTGPP